VLAGYEACCRVGMAVGKEHYRVWHNTSTCGPFGSAMASADLLGLSEDQAVWALGNAGDAIVGALGVPCRRRDEQAPAYRARRRIRRACGLAGEPGLHRSRPHPGGRERLLRRPLPRPPSRSGDGRPRAAMGADQDLHQALALLPPHPPGHRCGDRAPFRAWRCGSEGGQGRRYRAALDVCDRPRPEDPYSAKFSLQHCVAAP
jgi:hypothetical protein